MWQWCCFFFSCSSITFILQIWNDTVDLGLLALRKVELWDLAILQKAGSLTVGGWEENICIWAILCQVYLKYIHPLMYLIVGVKQFWIIETFEIREGAILGNCNSVWPFNKLWLIHIQMVERVRDYFKSHFTKDWLSFVLYLIQSHKFARIKWTNQFYNFNQSVKSFFWSCCLFSVGLGRDHYAQLCEWNQCYSCQCTPAHLPDAVV